MNHMENGRNSNGTATAALIFALVAAAFSALTYFTLPAMVARGVENVEAMKVGGPEKYAQLKKIYSENAAIFGEQVDQIQAQIDMYQQMQTQTGGEEAMPTETMGEGMTGTTMPAGEMMMTGDEAMSQ